MLIQFTVGNFLSFKNKATLIMVAARIKSRDPKIDGNNTIPVKGDLKLLTSAAVYGANGSGKSNLVIALGTMRSIVLTSSKESRVGESLPITPFRLSTITEAEPAFFETIFLIDGRQYRYGFEATRQKIITEWLFTVPSTKEATLFVRDENGIRISARFKEGKGLEERTRPNALFLSVVANFNGTISNQVLKWYQQLGIISGLDDTVYRNFTVKSFASGMLKPEIIALVRKLDLGITDIFYQNIEKSKIILPTDMPEELKSLIMNNIKGDITEIKTVHEKWGLEKPEGTAVFDLGDESNGTQKLFFLSGPLLETLKNEELLIIDEMEARLHPLMTKAIIGLFNSLETNPKRSQLIFTTHDTNLLSNKLFRRDQIWFIEKDSFGASHLYSLVELKVRNDASFESDYIEGRYGAIPYIGDIQQVISGTE